MFRFRHCFLACLLIFAACSSAPPDKALVALRTQPVQPGHARLIVYMPKRYVGTGNGIQFELDGKRVCDLQAGEYFVREITPLTHDFSFSYCGTRNLTHVTLLAQEGHKYYLRVMPYDSSLTGRLSGYPTDVVEPGEDAHINGPFQVKQVDEATALKALESLTYKPGYH